MDSLVKTAVHCSLLTRRMMKFFESFFQYCLHSFSFHYYLSSTSTRTHPSTHKLFGIKPPPPASLRSSPIYKHYSKQSVAAAAKKQAEDTARIGREGGIHFAYAQARKKQRKTLQASDRVRVSWRDLGPRDRSSKLNSHLLNYSSHSLIPFYLSVPSVRTVERDPGERVVL